jgi:multicomponent Na+:H+ antiporter subunit E
VEVAVEVVHPAPRRAPAIIDVPLDVTNDSQITLLSHVITLTPGTMVMGLSHDHRELRLHGMFVGEPQRFIGEIKHEFERRVMEVLPCRQS